MHVSRNVVSLSEISAVNLIVGWWLFALFNEMFYSVSVCSPEREDVVYVMFPNERFKNALAKDFRLYLLLVIVPRLFPFRHVACRNVPRAIDWSEKKRTRNASLRTRNSDLWRCWARDFFFKNYITVCKFS